VVTNSEGAGAPHALLVELLRCPCYEARAEAIRMLKRQVRQCRAAGLAAVTRRQNPLNMKPRNSRLGSRNMLGDLLT